jgi:hypothetical protein
VWSKGDNDSDSGGDDDDDDDDDDRRFRNTCEYVRCVCAGVRKQGVQGRRRGERRSRGAKRPGRVGFRDAYSRCGLIVWTNEARTRVGWVVVRYGER